MWKSLSRTISIPANCAEVLDSAGDEAVLPTDWPVPSEGGFSATGPAAPSPGAPVERPASTVSAFCNGFGAAAPPAADAPLGASGATSCGGAATRSGPRAGGSASSTITVSRGSAPGSTRARTGFEAWSTSRTPSSLACASTFWIGPVASACCGDAKGAATAAPGRKTVTGLPSSPGCTTARTGRVVTATIRGPAICTLRSNGRTEHTSLETRY